MNDFVKSLAVRQRQRLVASLMEHFERRVAPLIPVEHRDIATKAFRDKVMSSVGVYHDMTLDMLNSAVGEAVLNQDAFELLQQIHDSQQHLLRKG